MDQPLPDDAVIPPFLRRHKAWLLWHYEKKDKDKKPRKVPLYVGGGRRRFAHGSPEDRERLATYDDAVAAARRADCYLGFAMLPDWGLVALDFDRCLDDSGRLHPDAESVAGETYAELSPSGKGVRAFYSGNLEDRKNTKHEDFGFEVFCSRGFVTVTGNVLPQSQLLVGTLENAPCVSDFVSKLYVTRCAPQDQARAPVSTMPGPGRLSDLDSVLARIPNGAELSYDDWLRIGMAVHYESGGSADGLALWDRHSARWVAYEGLDDLERRWSGFGGDGREAMSFVTGGTLRATAERYADVRDAFDDLTLGSPEDVDEDAYDFPLSSYAGVDPAPRQWIVGGLVPRGFVTLLAGHGGTGKSLLGLMLQIAGAAGQQFVGRATTAPRSLGFYGEEDRPELARRAYDVCRGLKIDRAVPDHAYVRPLHGEDSVIALWNGTRLVKTDLYRKFEQRIKVRTPDVVVLDNIARLFSGNENDRAHVTQFITMLEHWAIEYQCGVLLIGHPSKGGAEYSGSTHWEAGVRSRLYFTRPESAEGQDPREVADLRLLSVGKANFGPAGDQIRLRWINGCFQTDWFHAVGDRSDNADAFFLACLDILYARHEAVDHKRNSKRYAPRVMTDMLDGAGNKYSVKELTAALDRLLKNGRIKLNRAVIRRPNRHTIYGIARAEWSKNNLPD